MSSLAEFYFYEMNMSNQQIWDVLFNCEGFHLACSVSKLSAAGYTISIPIWSSFSRPILQVISLHFDDDAFWWPFLHISIKYECELHSVKSSVIHNNIPQVNQSSTESATIDVHWKYNA